MYVTSNDTAAPVSVSRARALKNVEARIRRIVEFGGGARRRKPCSTASRPSARPGSSRWTKRRSPVGSACTPATSSTAGACRGWRADVQGRARVLRRRAPREPTVGYGARRCRVREQERQRPQAKSRAAVPRKGTRSRKEQSVHRTHTDDRLDALFGEEHKEPQHHGGDEHPAETRRARSIELTRKAFLARFIRPEDDDG
jgi:hypothetical protein